MSRLSSVVVVGLLGSLLWLGALSFPLTSAAQGAFATNTPTAPDAAATPTPDMNSEVVPAVPATPTVTGPPASAFNYSLRLWLEDDLLDLIRQQIDALATADDSADAQLALQLSLYELQQRFPQAPSDPQRRQRLVEALLAAPRGAVDMRRIVRPYLLAELNRGPDRETFTYTGFEVEVLRANLDNRGAEDVVLRMRYRDEERGLLYDDVALALGTDTGSYTLVPDAFTLYAAPFGGVEAIVLRRIADVNGDSLAEVVLRVSDEQINDRLYILQVRNGLAQDLAPPENPLRFSEIIRWSPDSDTDTAPELVVNTLREESMLPNFPCVSRQEFTWRYERNFYRPSSGLNSRFTPVDSLGCTLWMEQPLFAKPPSEAISIIENALVTYSFEAPGANRALMTLAMLYVLTGRLDDARATAQAVLPVDDTESWAYEQAQTLLDALDNPDATPLEICETLALASETAPACDMDAVLGNYLANVELNIDDDLTEQLTEAGLPVQERVIVREVGRAERIAVQFDLARTQWWGFVQGRDGAYLVEPIATPAGYEVTPEATQPVQPSAAAYAALLQNDNPQSALNILQNLAQNNPDVPFSPEGLYLQALTYDLTADREAARLTYYDVWEQYPGTVWGRLAAAHLQQR